MLGIGIKSYIGIVIGIVVVLSARGYCQERNILDFSNKVFTEPVNAEYFFDIKDSCIIIDSVLYGTIPRVTFPCTTDFRSNYFKSVVNLSAARFMNSVIFKNTHFFKNVNFVNVKILGDADFAGIKCSSTVDFTNLSCDSAIDFRGSQFFDKTIFNNSEYFSWANFSNCEFHGFTSFKSLDLMNNDPIYFDSCLFINMTDFSLADFGAQADFSRSTFSNTIIFDDATLPDLLNLAFITFEESSSGINFTQTKPPINSPRCKINLLGSDVSKILINMELFELWFPDGSKYDDQLAVCEGVLKQFDDRGLKESYEILDKEYRSFVNKHKGWVYRNIIDPFQKGWWGYGYNPEYVFAWSVLLWLLFSYINLKWYSALKEHVFDVPFLENYSDLKIDTNSHMIKYVLRVMTYTAVIFFGLKLNASTFKKQIINSHPWLFAYLIIIYISGLVCLGFIVNIIFTK